MNINKIITQFGVYNNAINSFFNKVISHLSDEIIDMNKILIDNSIPDAKIESVESMLDKKTYLLEILLFIINNDKETSESIQRSLIYEDFEIEIVLLEQDKLTFMVYTYKKENNLLPKFDKDDSSLYDTVIDSISYLFPSINSTLLLPDKDIVLESEVPKSAKKVNFNIENTENLIFDIRSLYDVTYINKHFPDIKMYSGINNEIIERFSISTKYSKLKTDKDTSIISKTIHNIPNIYQYLGKGPDKKKYYRKLLNYEKYNFAQYYGSLNASLFVVNFENKRLMMFKKNYNKKYKKKIITPEVHGRIKAHFYQKKERLGAAIMHSIYNPDFTDDQIINLYSFALLFDNDGSLYNHESMNRITSFSDINNI